MTGQSRRGDGRTWYPPNAIAAAAVEKAMKAVLDVKEEKKKRKKEARKAAKQAEKEKQKRRTLKWPAQTRKHKRRRGRK
jgi:hypothetical protein